MRNYSIDIDKAVNRLVPHYFGGRKFMLLMLSLLHPLKTLSATWDQWTKKIYQEASMTSQVYLFTHFLNHRLSQYFVNPKDKIVIRDVTIYGTAIYWKYVQAKKGCNVLRTKHETEKSTVKLFYHDEPQEYTGIRFVVECPSITITKEKMTIMLREMLDRYRVVGRNYVIKYKE